MQIIEENAENLKVFAHFIHNINFNNDARITGKNKQDEFEYITWEGEG